MTTDYCSFGGCTNSINKNNTSGRCRDHRRANEEIRLCSHPECNATLRSHNQSGLCTQHKHVNKTLDDRGESGDIGPGLLNIEPYSAIPAMPTVVTSSDTLILRNHDDAVTHAFHQGENTTEHQSQTIKLMDALDLVPVAVLDDDNVETNLLGKSTAIHSLELKQKRGHKLSIMRNPKKLKMDPSPIRFPAMPIELEFILRNSFAKKVLENHKYAEMTDEIVKLLNQDWFFRPQMRFVAAKILSGAILVDPISSHALLINTVELYGRSSLVDAHHERCLNKRGIPAVSTNPPTSSRYKGIWAISVKDNDGTKLSIATKSFNALVTSSIRLDTKHAAELGPTTSKFDIDTKHGRDIQIFFNEENYIEATKIALNQHAANISDTDILQQLRQIRSKFNDHSSYIPSRSSSLHCDFHRLQPQTIFTYCTFDTSSSHCDGKLASQLFAHIAREVINKKEEAMLHKSVITNISGKCKPGGKVKDILDDISELFANGCTAIKILDNNIPLCNHLKLLAHILHSYISQANQTIANEIGIIFDQSQ